MEEEKNITLKLYTLCKNENEKEGRVKATIPPSSLTAAFTEMEFSRENEDYLPLKVLQGN